MQVAKGRQSIPLHPRGACQFRVLQVAMVNAQCDAAGKKAGRETTPLNFDWLTLHGVLQEAVYGCRVDNESLREAAGSPFGFILALRESDRVSTPSHLESRTVL